MTEQMDPLAFLKQTNFKAHKVNGQDINFYPIAVSEVMNLKVLDGKVLGNLALLFGSGKKDKMFQTSTKKMGESSTEEYAEDAISPELAALRSKERKEALGVLIDSLFKGENIESITRLVMSSMRDSFGPETKITPKAILEVTSPVTFVEMVMGMIEANAEILSPFFARWSTVLMEKMGVAMTENISEKMNETL